MDYGEKAKALFLQGYNCAQAVFCAFAPELGLEMDTAAKLASSFGGGIGGMREVCGAVSGMMMAAGMLYGYDTPGDQAFKTAHYHLVRQLADEFRADNGSIICRELLGLGEHPKLADPEPRTPEYYKKRPCADKVASAAEILGRYLEAYPCK